MESADNGAFKAINANLNRVLKHFRGFACPGQKGALLQRKYSVENDNLIKNLDSPFFNYQTQLTRYNRTVTKNKLTF
jgi:hypothetical protein